MNNQDNEFIKTLLTNLQKHEGTLDKDIVLTQRAFLSALRTYFEIRTDNTLKNHAMFLIKEGMFEKEGEGFLVTEKAKRMFGFVTSQTSGVTIKPEKVNEIKEKDKV